MSYSFINSMEFNTITMNLNSSKPTSSTAYERAFASTNTTDRQLKARKRNRGKYNLHWLRSKIEDMRVENDNTSFTEKEVKLVNVLNITLNELFNNWDEETKKLGFTPKKKQRHE